MTGYRLDSIKGLRPGSFLQGEETSVSTINRIGSAIQQGNQVKEKYWITRSIKRPTGLILHVPYATKGEVERFIAIERDITEF